MSRDRARVAPWEYGDLESGAGLDGVEGGVHLGEGEFVRDQRGEVERARR